MILQTLLLIDYLDLVSINLDTPMSYWREQLQIVLTQVRCHIVALHQNLHLYFYHNKSDVWQTKVRFSQQLILNSITTTVQVVLVLDEKIDYSK